MDVRFAMLALGLLVAVPAAVQSHSVLDPEAAQNLLNEIARYHTAAGSEPKREARAEVWFDFGTRVQTLVGLLNQDVNAHGMNQPLAQEVIKRLAASGVKVVWSERSQRYSYDLEAFQRCWKLAPSGPHAAESRFQLLSAGFYSTLGLDPSKVGDEDVAAVTSAVAEEQRFLRDYPKEARAREVRFYLGVDCYRLSRHVRAPAQINAYKKCAREELEAVAIRYPDSIEARAAASLLETGDDHARR
jgi:hypothetical protein